MCFRLICVIHRVVLVGLVRRVLHAILLLGGCLLFLLSVVNPFLVYSEWSMRGGLEFVYWSYRSSWTSWTPTDPGYVTRVRNLSFWDYWYGSWELTYSGLSSAFILMFIVQVATLPVAALSFLFKKEILQHVSIMLSSLVALIMVYARVRLMDFMGGRADFSVGFWLTCFSIVLFSICYALLPEEFNNNAPAPFCQKTY